jgi:hypothetical protein
LQCTNITPSPGNGKSNSLIFKQLRQKSNFGGFAGSQVSENQTVSIQKPAKRHGGRALNAVPAKH